MKNNLDKINDLAKSLIKSQSINESLDEEFKMAEDRESKYENIEKLLKEIFNDRSY